MRLLPAVLALLLPLAVAAQGGAPRIGYVDMKRLLDQAPQVQLAHDRLQAEFAHRDRALQQQRDRLEALRASLQSDRASLTPAQQAARQQEIDRLDGSVRRARERLQEELKQRSAEELDKSWQTVSNAAVDYARSHGYDLLLPSPVIYASPAVDITDEILQQLQRNAGGARTP